MPFRYETITFFFFFIQDNAIFLKRIIINWKGYELHGFNVKKRVTVFVKISVILVNMCYEVRWVNGL